MSGKQGLVRTRPGADFVKVRRLTLKRCSVFVAGHVHKGRDASPDQLVDHRVGGRPHRGMRHSKANTPAKLHNSAHIPDHPHLLRSASRGPLPCLHRLGRVWTNCGDCRRQFFLPNSGDIRNSH